MALIAYKLSENQNLNWIFISEAWAGKFNLFIWALFFWPIKKFELAANWHFQLFKPFLSSAYQEKIILLLSTWNYFKLQSILVYFFGYSGDTYHIPFPVAVLYLNLIYVRHLNLKREDFISILPITIGDLRCISKYSMVVVFKSEYFL